MLSRVPVPSDFSDADIPELQEELGDRIPILGLETSTEVIYRPIWSRGRIMMGRLALTWGFLAALAVALFVMEQRMAIGEKLASEEGGVP